MRSDIGTKTRVNFKGSKIDGAKITPKKRHTGKVFKVKWSPLREGIFCSSSDDCTVRVWDFNCNSSIAILNGHTSYVRGVLWNPEIPYLLITSSWDTTIRVWDIRGSTCLELNEDHGSDVYEDYIDLFKTGLANHPLRPFMVASSSRDSTLRLWSISSYVSPLHMVLLTGEPWKNICGTLEQVSNPSNSVLLRGKQSKVILTMLTKSSKENQLGDLALYSEFFGVTNGESNLFDLISVILGIDGRSHNINLDKPEIMHRKYVLKHKMGEAQRAEMAKIGIGSKSRHAQLSTAATLQISTGNVQRYCELMIELGQWEASIALAPAVSLDYWKSLVSRYAEILLEQNSDRAIGYCIAAGMVDKLIDFHLSQGQFTSAFELSIANEEGNLSCPVPVDSNTSIYNDTNKGYLEKSVVALSTWYLSVGSPVKAACCYLAIDSHEKAMEMLLQGNELELVVTLGKIFDKMEVTCVKEALACLGRRCQAMGLWSLALRILKLGNKMAVHIDQLCIHCPLSITEKTEIYKMAQLPDLDECYIKAKLATQEKRNFEAIRYYLLSNECIEGLKLGLKYVKELIKNGEWREAKSITSYMSSIRNDKLQSSYCDRIELLALAAYFGALEAMHLEYKSVVPHLMIHAKNLVKKISIKNCWCITDDMMTSELESWQIQQRTNLEKKKLNQLTEFYSRCYESLDNKIKMCGSDTWNKGEILVCGTQLPSYSNKNICCLTSEVIQVHQGSGIDVLQFTSYFHHLLVYIRKAVPENFSSFRSHFITVLSF
ncbi:WD repeat-containing protein 17 [Nymphon striatum]|nr:WD repeat-containing protein 17 [Nymphon striatum]